MKNHLRAALPALGMVALLESRKQALEAMVAERLRAAREAGKAADVKQQGAELRKVKSQLEAARGTAKAA